MRFSKFAERFTSHSGTRQLMDDLGQLQHGDLEILNLGGGNPSRIPEVHDWFGNKLRELATTRELDNTFAAYDSPQGNQPFISAFARFLTAHCGWPIGAPNVLCTAGSQASFFLLFNAFSGVNTAGEKRRILLPQMPEYIGYSDLCLEADGIVSVPSKITLTGDHRFRYSLDTEALEQADGTVGAICISRPTNPTGNAISNTDLEWLLRLAEARDIPLILDNAYGNPLPGILFPPELSPPRWSKHLVACFSLSKLGLPGLRTGMVVADEALIDVLISANATLALANNSLGARLVLDLLADDQLTVFANQIIRPFYATKSRQAIAYCDAAFAGLDYRLHESDGAIFLWVWFPGLPITAQALYQRLKRRGVLVIPGHHFGPGHRGASKHLAECIRISYAQPDATLQRGIEVIAEEVRAAYAAGQQ